MTDRIDLHTHTTASDGTLRPRELVRLADASGLRALAVTDHDTVDGLEEAVSAGDELGLEVVPGVEISVEIGLGSMHLLGYFLNPQQPSALSKRLSILQQARADRNPRIIAKLNRLGMDITMEEVKRHSGEGQMGRPHIAYTLMAKGYVPGVQAAFDRYLKKGQPAYEEKFRFDPHGAFSLIHDAGGLSSLAHPYTITRDDDELENRIRMFKSMGLAALEVYYPEHTPEMVRSYTRLARKYDLLVTGGSDFHGDHKPEIRLGRGKGNLYIPYRVLEALKRRAM